MCLIESDYVIGTLSCEPGTEQPGMCKGLAKSSHDLPADLALAENGKIGELVFVEEPQLTMTLFSQVGVGDIVKYPKLPCARCEAAENSLLLLLPPCSELLLLKSIRLLCI